MKNKGQIALWVIVAALLVAAILLTYLVQRGPPVIEVKEFGVESYMQGCAIDAVNEAVDKMLPQGGFLAPENYVIYNSTKIEYLCENPGFFKTCRNQHPMLINEMKKEIESYIKPVIKQCFENKKKEIAGKGGTMETGEMNLSVSMAPGRVFVNILQDTKITMNEQTSTFNEFDAEVINPIYDLGNAAIDIANSEAKYCSFQYLGYMAVYQDLDIKVIRLSSQNKIYLIEDKNSGRILNIAIRSCAIPTGI